MNADVFLNNRYRLLGQIGSGGSSVIYKAMDTALSRVVAIKVLRPSLTSDPSFVVRFRNEARSVANLTHPNIVTLYDVGQDGTTHYFVMEYVEGRDLKKIIREEGALEVNRALNLAIQLCSGIGFAHRAGLVHADLKPQNLMVMPNESLKITDFGIAQALSDTRPSQRVDVVWGSPHYFAPEQARGEQPTPAADVYSIGVVMFEMLTGRLPYIRDSQQALALAHIRDPIPVVTDLNPNVPDALSKIVYKAMSKDPATRYRMADQLANVLMAYRDGVAPQPVSPSRPFPGGIGPLPVAARRPMSAFVSYSSKNPAERAAVVEELVKLNTVSDVWFDDALKSRGGQEWWDKILEQVRNRDLFVFVLTPQSLLSFACYLEYTYANALNKWILPVKSQPFEIPLLPAALKDKQIVNFTGEDRVMQLASSVEDIVQHGIKPPSLALVQPPPIPYDEFNPVAAKLLNTTEPLSAYDQHALYGMLEDTLQAERTRDGAAILLGIMQHRGDILLSVGDKIRKLLDNTSKPNFMNRLFGRKNK